MSADELVDVGAEVTAYSVVPTGASLDEAEEFEELVVGRVGGRATVVDQQFEPDLPRVVEQEFAVWPVDLTGTGGQDENGEGCRSPLSVTFRSFWLTLETAVKDLLFARLVHEAVAWTFSDP